MQEIERLIVALQTADKELVCTSGNWKEGEDGIVAIHIQAPNWQLILP